VGDYGAAQSLALALSDLTRALFLEPSPAPAKQALALLGLCSPAVRSPLCPVTQTTRAALETALSALADLEGRERP
jgi:4-hydroxy-tetrahydrodipicolinate synthase